MKKESIVTFIIVIFIIIGECISNSHTKEKLGKVEDELSNLKEEILNSDEEINYYIEKVSNIYENWEEENELLSYYLEHDELEKINTQIILVKGYLESDSPQDSIPDIEEGIYIINHIKEKQAFNLKNIF